MHTVRHKKKLVARIRRVKGQIEAVERALTEERGCEEVARTIAAAKGGLEALVRSTAATYAAQGLRINAVAPGMTETPMTANMLKMPAMREGAARQYPLGGIQSAEQVADVMAFLLGDGAARLTGQVLAVDGGFTTVRPLVR